MHYIIPSIVCLVNSCASDSHLLVYVVICADFMLHQICVMSSTCIEMTARRSSRWAHLFVLVLNRMHGSHVTTAVIHDMVVFEMMTLRPFDTSGQRSGHQVL